MAKPVDLVIRNARIVSPESIVEASLDPLLISRPAHIVLVAGLGVVVIALLRRIRLWRTAPS